MKTTAQKLHDLLEELNTATEKGRLASNRRDCENNIKTLLMLAQKMQDKPSPNHQAMVKAWRNPELHEYIRSLAPEMGLNGSTDETDQLKSLRVQQLIRDRIDELARDAFTDMMVAQADGNKPQDAKRVVN
jgi:hypothetical protein